MLIKLYYDNQIVFADRKEVISNGNFHGEYPAKVCYLLTCNAAWYCAVWWFGHAAVAYYDDFMRIIFK